MKNAVRFDLGTRLFVVWMMMATLAWGEKEDPVKRYDYLLDAGQCHQRFYEDAKQRIDVGAARGTAVDDFRNALTELKKTLQAKAPEAEIDDRFKKCDEKLAGLEEMVVPESLRIDLLEEWEEARTLFRFVKDGEALARLKGQFETLGREIRSFASNTAAYGQAVAAFAEKRAALRRLKDELRTSFHVPWQSGVSTVSFGRFGWAITDGLLCDTVAFTSIETTAEAKQLGRRASADMAISTTGCDVVFPETSVRLSLAPKGIEPVRAQVTDVNWIGKTLSIRSPDDQRIGTVYTTLQRIATRFRYDVPQVRCRITGMVPERSYLSYWSRSGWQQAPLGQAKGIELSGNDELQRPWIVLDLADGERDQRFLVAVQFSRRPSRIEVAPEGLILGVGSGALGDLWIFRPMGVDRQPAVASTQTGHPPAETLIRRIDDLCALNLAWPKTCSEFYKIDPADQKVVIRNEVEFEILSDDWKTAAVAHAAVPPVLMLAWVYDLPVTIDGEIRTWDVPTKYGPFGTVTGRELEYRLPVPPRDRHGLFVVDRHKELVEEIPRWVVYWGGPDRTFVDLAYSGTGSALHAWCYLTEENRKTIDKADRLLRQELAPDRFWKHFKWRMEPLTKRRYCYDYPRGCYGRSPIVDINWGNSLVMYGLDQWAAYLGRWDELARAWPAVWPLTDYLIKSHDWAWMADSISEQGEGAAIDCLTASYAGWVAAVRLTRTLGKAPEEAQAVYLGAKTAICHAMRFAYLDYVQRHNLWHRDSPGLGTVNGFHEFDAFIHPRHDPPWWGVCSLSGYGVEPECFDAAFRYAGEHRMRQWWQVVNRIYPQWFDGSKAYPAGTIYNGNSGFITLPVIYLQLRFGTPDEQLFDWLGQVHGNHEGYWQAPTVLGAIASRPCPVQLADWDRCTFELARYHPAKKQAEVTFTNDAPNAQHVTFACQHPPSQVLLNGQAVKFQMRTDIWGTQLFAVELPPGRHYLQLAFPDNTPTP